MAILDICGLLLLSLVHILCFIFLRGKVAPATGGPKSFSEPVIYSLCDQSGWHKHSLSYYLMCLTLKTIL